MKLKCCKTKNHLKSLARYRRNTSTSRTNGVHFLGRVVTLERIEIERERSIERK
jgi:hypothetical protein